MSDFQKLVARIGQIQNLLKEADPAKALPVLRYKTAMGVALEYYSRTDSPIVDAFNRCRDRFAEEERRHGEVARDRELARIEAEINRLRVDLPELAAAARFDLLGIVRGCAE